MVAGNSKTPKQPPVTDVNRSIRQIGRAWLRARQGKNQRRCERLDGSKVFTADAHRTQADSRKRR